MAQNKRDVRPLFVADAKFVKRSAFLFSGFQASKIPAVIAMITALVELSGLWEVKGWVLFPRGLNVIR